MESSVSRFVPRIFSFGTQGARVLTTGLTAFHALAGSTVTASPGGGKSYVVKGWHWLIACFTGSRYYKPSWERWAGGRHWRTWRLRSDVFSGGGPPSDALRRGQREPGTESAGL